MTIIRPKFVQVLRDDVQRVGVESAYVLALVRYVTALDGERNGRVVLEGTRWWQASYADIAESLGGAMSRYSVRRIMTRLEETEELMSRQPRICDGDQTKAYRIPSDQPMCENATAVTSQSAESQQDSPGGVAESAGGVAESQQGVLRNRTFFLPMEELKNKELGERERVPAPATDPPLVCSRHPNGNDKDACVGCARIEREKGRLAKADREDWGRAAARVAAEREERQRVAAIFGGRPVIDGEVIPALPPAGYARPGQEQP